MSTTEFTIVLVMALVTTFAAFVLARRERASWHRFRRLDLHSLGVLYAGAGAVVLWVRLATDNPDNFWVLAGGFSIVLMYLLLPDPRLR